ncbi:hypothetical protein [Nitrosomonas sp.]|uniref:hypothetical protein n=1 Tax=Nitrosomonas sp. TaxID=42353 RepID=UPI002731D0D3|nr:hypothetical protein [Nitrosomonas sp.]MDP2223369.1 hypothetical protein [Nitrosomonas sp.]
MKSKTIEYSSIKLAGLAAAGILFLAASQANATSLPSMILAPQAGPGQWRLPSITLDKSRVVTAAEPLSGMTEKFLRSGMVLP